MNTNECGLNMCRVVWHRDTEVGPGRLEAERKTRQDINGCVERGPHVREFVLMEANDWLCLTLIGRAQRTRRRGSYLHIIVSVYFVSPLTHCEILQLNKKKNLKNQ